jgi:hypothetical protein
MFTNLRYSPVCISAFDIPNLAKLSLVVLNVVNILYEGHLKYLVSASVSIHIIYAREHKLKLVCVCIPGAAFMNTLMNLRGPYKTTNFFSSLAATGFSRTFMLVGVTYT